MKKRLATLIAILFVVNSFAQTINKVIPYKDKKRDYFYYKASYPVNNKEILTIFTFKKVITLKLYNSDLEEIATKDIERESKGNYSTDYYLSNKYLFITEKVNKKKITTRITLTESFDSKSFNDANQKLFTVDLSENNYYYKVSEGTSYFTRVNFETETSVNYIAAIDDGKEINVTEFYTFKDSEYIAVTREVSENYQVALHDNTGKEIDVFNRLENNIFKSTTDFKNHKDAMYVLGNYKETPKKDDITTHINHTQKNKPEYTGIYVKSMNAKNPIDKYYNYSQFKNLNKQILLDKREKDLAKFRFVLEDIIFTDNEKIIVATIDKDAYKEVYDALDNAYRTAHSGQELNYVLVFGINNAGDILWDQVITLDWKNHDKYEVGYSCTINSSPKTVNIGKEDGVIKCHYSFGDNIYYFEVINGEIANKKETLYPLKTVHTSKLLEFQYENSFYWYDNFYFNQDGIGEVLMLDKTEFNR